MIARLSHLPRVLDCQEHRVLRHLKEGGEASSPLLQDLGLLHVVLEGEEKGVLLYIEVGHGLPGEVGHALTLGQLQGEGSCT